MNFESDPPKEWRMVGLSQGWSGSCSMAGKDWPWHVKREGGGPTITITGVASSADEAKAAMKSAYEPLAPVEMELERDEWKAKAEAFGQKAHHLQEKCRRLVGSIRAIETAWENIGDSRAPSAVEIKSVREAIDKAKENA